MPAVYIITRIVLIPLITYRCKYSCKTQKKYILAAYSFILSTANGLFIEMFIMLPLQLKFPQIFEMEFVKRLSGAFMYVCALLIVQLVGASISIIVMNEEQLENNETFKAVFGFMYEDIKTEFISSRAAPFLY